MSVAPPVLLIAFNRPDTLEEVIRALTPLAPARMYVAADGPRAGRNGEAEACAEVRALLTALPWPCTITTRFLDSNAGCAVGVSGALTWFFEHEESGVILEDDCVPDPSFLAYCADALARHRDDEQVMSVLGTRFAPPVETQRASYSFTRLFSPWGWASWRRAWQRYELQLGDWRAKLPEYGRPLPSFPSSSNRCWARKLDGVAPRGKELRVPHTWDYQWSFAHMRHDGLCVLPKQNLVSNIGVGPGATHTGRESVWLNFPRGSATLPLIAPDTIESDRAAELHRERWHLNHRGMIARKYWQIRNRHAIGSVAARRGWSEVRAG